LSCLSVRYLFLHEIHLLNFYSTMKCLTNLAKTENFKEKCSYMWLFCKYNSFESTGA
jgi:hypothetical protein